MGQRYPTIAPTLRRAWDYVILLFAFPPAIRKVIYTTNAVERLQPFVAQGDQDPGQLPHWMRRLKLLYLAIQNAGLALASADRMHRHEPVRHSVRRLLSQRAETTINDPAARLHRRSDTPAS